MHTYAFWLYEELQPRVGLGKGPVPVLINGVKVKAKGSSSRLECLKRNNVCVECGIKGVIWALQSWGPERPHLNLYALNEREEMILMTRDHILPLSWGGPDHIDNLQTMCTNCNSRKGNYVNPIFHKMINETKLELINHNINYWTKKGEEYAILAKEFKSTKIVESGSKPTTIWDGLVNFAKQQVSLLKEELKELSKEKVA